LLPKGSIVLAGAATVAHQLAVGDRIELRVDSMAPMVVTVTE
jgi:hypothetical protein